MSETEYQGLMRALSDGVERDGRDVQALTDAEVTSVIKWGNQAKIWEGLLHLVVNGDVLISPARSGDPDDVKLRLRSPDG